MSDIIYIEDVPYSLEAVLSLRAEIDSKLPASKLKDLDLEHELVIQLMAVKGLQSQVINDQHEEANKKAQVANTVASTLQQLVKMQIDLHTAERLKEIESRLIKALDKVPKEYLEEFFAWYENGVIV